MLANLMPGLRELRAPFAAGVLWVLAAWIHWEPSVPDAAAAMAAGGLSKSIYRLSALAPSAMVGGVAAFLVYLLGSLSVAVLSDRLRALFRRSISPADRTLNVLTKPTINGLTILARRTRRNVEATLVHSGKEIEFLLATERDAAPIVSAKDAWWFRTLAWLRAFRRRRRWRAIPRHGTPAPPEAAVDRELVEMAARDLEVVATARLLGKDQELYSAIDRRRAEVEFRLAVVPPLLVSFLLAARRLDESLPAMGVIAVGFVAAFGLCWDALKQQREANGLLVDAAVDGRVELPSLERLRHGAHSMVEMTPAAAASRLERELARSVAMVKKLDSFPSSAGAAGDAVAETERWFHWLRDRLSEPVLQSAQQSLDALITAVDIWEAGVLGRAKQGWVADAEAAREQALKRFDEFRIVALASLEPPKQKHDL